MVGMKDVGGWVKLNKFNACWCKLGVIMEPHILMNKPNVVARSASVNLIIVALLN